MTKEKRFTEKEFIRLIRERYEHRNGNLYIKYPYSRNVRAGAKAGTAHNCGYRVIKICGELYLEHRLIWLLYNGVWPLGDIDHINHVKDDNRIENLRDVHRMVNTQNVIAARKNNKSSKYLGVTFHKRVGKFQSQIMVGGKKIHIGYFKTTLEASEAYQAAKKVYHSGAVISNATEQQAHNRGR